MKGLNVLFFMVWSVQPAIFKHVCKAVVKSGYELYHVCLLAQNRVVSMGRIFTKFCVWYFC